ncbi:MAG: PLDc N-terminal domain-containing protein, partial [Anaerolineae bacterium]|nr:PLDc N-terminal domain-containing protein [Anaerolineae bacterium]
MLIQVLLATFVVYTIATIIRLIIDNRMPQATWAWILTCLMFPGVGLIAYFFTGRSRKAFSKHRQLTHQTVGENLTQRLRHLVEQKEDNIEKIRLGRTQSYKKRLLHLLYENSSSVLTTNNQVEILQDGSEKYPRLIEDIQNAQHSIHLQYYIWSSDDFTEKVKTLLIEKVQQGVEVGILYDYLGSFGSLKRRYVRELREGGVQIFPYLYTSRIHNIGYRNHRKIAIIDGCISYIGGMNMGQEHLDGGKHFSSWRDTHLRLVGEAALLLQGMFLVEWYNTLGEK